MHQISKLYFVIKLYMFRASVVPIIRNYLLYARQLVRFIRLCDRFQAESGWIFDASSWLFYTKLITLHGHLNIKYGTNIFRKMVCAPPKCYCLLGYIL